MGTSIGTALTARLEEVYRDWAVGKARPHLQREHDAPPMPTGLPTLWRLADFVTLAHSQMQVTAPLGDERNRLRLDIPLGKLLDLFVKQPDGNLVTVEDLLRATVCLTLAPQAVAEVLCDRAPDERQRLLLHMLVQEAGVRDLHELRRSLMTAEGLHRVADVGLQATIHALWSRPLRSVFFTPPSEAGFWSWWPGAWTGLGRERPLREVATPSGELRLRTALYKFADGPVRPFEWSAELRGHPASDAPDAVAMGMVYTLPRGRSNERATLQDLVNASDAVADTDVLQMAAFLKQHADAERIIETSDLCFLWIWERRQGAPHGAGAACLGAALDQLRAAFTNVHTLVVDVRPQQFVPCGPFGEPAEVATERLDAVDRITHVVEGVARSQDIRLCPIVNRHQEGDTDKFALAALVDFKSVR